MGPKFNDECLYKRKEEINLRQVEDREKWRGASWPWRQGL